MTNTMNQASNDYFLQLNELSRNGIHRTGAKAANLGFAIFLKGALGKLTVFVLY